MVVCGGIKLNGCHSGGCHSSPSREEIVQKACSECSGRCNQVSRFTKMSHQMIINSVLILLSSARARSLFPTFSISSRYRRMSLKLKSQVRNKVKAFQILSWTKMRQKAD